MKKGALHFLGRKKSLFDTNMPARDMGEYTALLGPLALMENNRYSTIYWRITRPLYLVLTWTNEAPICPLHIPPEGNLSSISVFKCHVLMNRCVWFIHEIPASLMFKFLHGKSVTLLHTWLHSHTDPLSSTNCVHSVWFSVALTMLWGNCLGNSSQVGKVWL